MSKRYICTNPKKPTCDKSKANRKVFGYCLIVDCKWLKLNTNILKGRKRRGTSSRT